MQDFQQLQLGNRMDVSYLMDDEDRVCDTCAGMANKDLIVCNKCHDGAEHTYCMHNDEWSKLQEKLEGHKDWICQECIPREGTNKLVQDDIEVPKRIKNEHLCQSSTKCESSKDSKVKSRSVSAGKSGENDLELSAKRQRVPIRTSKLKSVNEIVYSIPERSSGEPLSSGPNFCNNDAVEDFGQLDHRLHLNHMTQVRGTLISQDVVIPENHHKWLGKFQIHNTERIIRTYDGIQAHLSTCASSKVFKVVSKLPKIIILEELPRLKIWQSQFIENQVTEENIALYFFAHDSNSYKYYDQLLNYMIKNDLALKGNLDGVELLMFPSNILPENSQCWNNMFFLWGIFKGQKIENPNVSKILPFDLNAYPQDGDDMTIINEIPEFEPSRDAILLVRENSNDKRGDANANCEEIYTNVSSRLESETPENGSIGIEDNNVEAPSTPLSVASISTTFNPFDWAMVYGLVYLKTGL